MKYLILFFTLFGGFFVFAQNYESSSNRNNNLVFDTELLIQVLVIIAIFSCIYAIISYFEGKGKLKDSIKTDGEFYTLVVLIMVSVAYVFFVKTMREQEDDPNFLWFLGIVLKAVAASVVSHFAGKQNRNKTLWWFLGFFEYHSALLVLAFSKALLAPQKEKMEGLNVLNDDYTKKVQELNNLYNKGILTEFEVTEKRKEALKDLENQKEEFQLSQKNSENKKRENSFIQNLQQALNDGHITQEQYNEKLNNFLKPKSEF